MRLKVEEMIVRRTPLDQRGTRYVQQHLPQRGALARFINRQLDLAVGIVFTYSTGSPGQYDLFDLDGWDGGGKGNRMAVEAHVQEYLASEPAALVVMEDDVRSPYDPWFDRKPDEPVFFYTGTRPSYDPATGETRPYGDVYWYLTDTDADAARISHVMISSYGYFFTGVLTCRPESPPAIPRHEYVAKAYLQSLVTEMRAIILGAYDDTGYLVWVRDDQDLEAWPSERLVLG